MKVHRFFTPHTAPGRLIRIGDKDTLDQMRNVLRLSVGDTVILADGELNEVIAEVLRLSKDFGEFTLLDKRLNAAEPEKYCALNCSILKRENFELAVQKATETGVKEIQPMICGRTVKLNLRTERLRRVAKEAAEQSGRGVIPKIHGALNFEEAIARADKNDFNIIFDLTGEPLGKIQKSAVRRVNIFIGPEGGFSEAEVSLAKRNGFIIANLGKLTLRAETAAIIASYLMVNK